MLKRQVRIIRLKGQRGQAMVELAIFGSIFLTVLGLLLQWGLSVNYQQEAKMKAFRRALVDAAALGGSGQKGEVVLLQDRAFVEPGDELGLPNRYPIGSSANVTWTVDLLGGQQYGNPNFLPRVKYLVNGQSVISEIDGQDTLKLSGYKTVYFPGPDASGAAYDGAWGIIKRKINVPYSEQGTGWEWQDIELRWDFLLIEEGDAFIGRILKKVQGELNAKILMEELKNKQADVDGDGEEEFIIGYEYVDGEDYEEVDENGNVHIYDPVYVTEIRCIDYQEGEFNIRERTHGLQRGYVKNVSVDASIQQEENLADSDMIVTEIRVNATENIIHRMRTKFGERELVNHGIFETNKTTRWETTNN